MIIWIVRKHLRQQDEGRHAYLADFTIHGQYRNRAGAQAVADKKEKKWSGFVYTVYGLKVKEFL